MHGCLPYALVVVGCLFVLKKKDPYFQNTFTLVSFMVYLRSFFKCHCLNQLVISFLGYKMPPQPSLHEFRVYYELSLVNVWPNQFHPIISTKDCYASKSGPQRWDKAGISYWGLAFLKGLSWVLFIYLYLYIYIKKAEKRTQSSFCWKVSTKNK